MHIWRIPYTTHNGLMARAAPGTHEEVGRMLLRRHVPKDGAVLDLAAGTGALLSRLRSLGYKNLQAIERDPSSFGLAGVTPLRTDLNGPFAAALSDRFRLITAVEIIEHLDSPRLFVKGIYDLLEPGGYAVISTPNIGHWLSRLQFLLTGIPKFFTVKDFRDQRHISPILDHHMRIMLDECGFELLEVVTTASSWGLLIRLLTLPVRVWFKLLGESDTDGNVNIYLIKKPHT